MKRYFRESENVVDCRTDNVRCSQSVAESKAKMSLPVQVVQLDYNYALVFFVVVSSLLLMKLIYNEFKPAENL